MSKPLAGMKLIQQPGRCAPKCCVPKSLSRSYQPKVKEAEEQGVRRRRRAAAVVPGAGRTARVPRARSPDEACALRAVRRS